MVGARSVFLFVCAVVFREASALRGRSYHPPWGTESFPTRRSMMCRLIASRPAPETTRILGEYTVGKMLHRAILEAWADFPNHGFRRPATVAAADLAWSKSLDCVDASDGWGCMFGRGAACVADDGPVAAQTFNASDEEVATLLGFVAGAMVPQIRHLTAERNIQRVPSPSPAAIGVHGRFGDSCEKFVSMRREHAQVDQWDDDRRRPCFEPAVYIREIKELAELYNTTNVIAATDSEDFMQALLAETTLNVRFNDIDRSVLQSRIWVEQRTDFTRDAVEGMFSDLWLLSQADALVGQFGSHFTRCAYYLMTARKGRPPPYAAVDGSGVLEPAIRLINYLK